MTKFSKILPNIPVDILIELFSSLPIETLVRCRSVCKLWCNILDDLKFIYDHLEKGPFEFTHLALCKDETQETNLIKLRKRRNRFYNFYLLKVDNSFGILDKVWKKSENPTNIMMKSKSFIVGCSKGVVCFIREKKLHFVNPLFLNDVVTVPLPPLTMDLMEGHDYSSYLSYSFGFDESSKRFKVICILQCHYGCGRGNSTSAPLVLDLGIGKSSSCREVCWRSLLSKSIRHPCIRSKGCQSVFVDGAFVFLGRRRSPGCGNLEILSFNLEKETFKTITLPISAPVLDNRMSLFDFNGSIGLLGLVGGETMWIWVLDLYKDITTWIVKFLIKVPTNWFESVHALGINKANCEIMFKINFGGYYAYNMKTGITTAPLDCPPGLDRILLQQGSLIRASNLTPLDCSS
ncbi:hypothetical protein LIER_07945 [Lithospermum erythrorhizon]|uniref:F-box domain-containing protein n=1 Tax=Lithospermum erythrorhizon TaxID=34254 RepID=A0AAV3PBV3_LITER